MSDLPISQSLLEVERHSMAHVMAAAVFELFPDAVFGVGPVIDNGAFYDFVLPRTLIPEDLALIDAKIQSILARNPVFKSEKVTLDHAITFFRERGQLLKVELLENIRDFGTTKLDDESRAITDDVDNITIYRLVDEQTGEMLFEDLCRGPHTEHFGHLRTLGYKLDKFSSAYWRGDQERGISMQRVYMLVFESPKELEVFVQAREEAKQFDHRVLGQQLGLFSFSDLVGPGLPLWSPAGTSIRNNLRGLLNQISKKYGSKEVTIPHLAKIDLYEKSGHAAKFAGELFHVKSHYDIEFVLKPVNCPHHTQIYASQQRSYKDLPLRYIESTMQYRDEKPGQIGGLTRVRSITLDDGHTFCTPEQIKEELVSLCRVISEFYTGLNMYDNHWVSISVRDYSTPEKYIGTSQNWDTAEAMLKEINQELDLGGVIMEGEAALYGPKIDFMYKDLQGNDRQLSTVQLDFATPVRFGLTYVDVDGSEKPPVMIHRAILGSYERFIAILLERTKGRLPFWLAPEQIRILTINDQPTTIDYVHKVIEIIESTVLMKPLKYNEPRFSVDDSAESLGKKIRNAEGLKVPVMIIVGPKDIDAGQVSIRTNNGETKIMITELQAYISSIV